MLTDEIPLDSIEGSALAKSLRRQLVIASGNSSRIWHVYKPHSVLSISIQFRISLRAHGRPNL